jgi:catechol-2,3-dioxygenase
MTSPTKLAHVVLWTKQVPRMRDWYVTVLDGRVVYENPAAAFLTYDDEHHRVALADPDGAAKLAGELGGGSDGLVGAGSSSGGGGEPGLHGLSHVAFTYAGLDDLLENFERLQGVSIEPTSAINHGTTTSLYYADPDRNQIELQVDNFGTTEEGVAFMESESFARNPIGVPVDPAALLARLRAGESAEVLTRPTW